MNASAKRREGRSTFSFWSAVKTAICRSVTFDHIMNCCFHCMTETLADHSSVSSAEAAHLNEYVR
jgi:hypothetical protein